MIKIKTKPSADTKLAHTMAVKKTVVAGKLESDPSTVSYAVENAAKLKYSKDIYSTMFSLSNEKLEYEVEAEPTDLNTDDKTFKFKHAGEYEFASNKYETTQALEFGTPKVGPLRFWSNTELKWNTLHEKSLKQALSVQVDTFNAGFNIEHDLSNLTEAKA